LKGFKPEQALLGNSMPIQNCSSPVWEAECFWASQVFMGVNQSGNTTWQSNAVSSCAEKSESHWSFMHCMRVAHRGTEIVISDSQFEWFTPLQFGWLTVGWLTWKVLSLSGNKELSSKEVWGCQNNSKSRWPPQLAMTLHMGMEMSWQFKLQSSISTAEGFLLWQVFIMVGVKSARWVSNQLSNQPGGCQMSNHPGGCQIMEGVKSAIYYGGCQISQLSR
jgi:hypothetical protein